ncbi:hypothetical protein [Pseudorhodobacter ferrugineus]|uniref:hypothetical protein n=1 Tax=Pseudorhodobacter ferrugineus TaxID=77008 RepID=UPI0003B3DE8F|nr:hypothetical protein [Pseudorhodobacter ferrugineus]
MKNIIPLLALLATPALSAPPVIETVAATRSGDAWRFDVTLAHPDTGWDHYADAWEVLAPDGASLGLRVLTHPHVEEQPFTRSLAGISVPVGTHYVMIRARCLVDGWSDAVFRLDLPQ